MAEWEIYFKKEDSVPQKFLNIICAGGNQQYIERPLRAVVPEGNINGITAKRVLSGRTINSLKTGGDNFDDRYYRVVSMFSEVIE